MDSKKSFVLYVDYRQHLKLLTDEERGRFLMVLFDYAELGIVPELTGASAMAFSFIRAQIDRDNEKWNNRKEKARKSANARWNDTKDEQQEMRTHANASERMPTDAKHAVTVNANVNATATVNVKEEDILPGAQSAPDPPVVELMLNDKTTYAVTEDQVAKWASLYPAVDVPAQLRKMVGWCDANPKKRKTRGGIKRFINSWLSGEQDKGGANYSGDHKNGDKNADGQVFYNGKWVNV